MKNTGQVNKEPIIKKILLNNKILRGFVNLHSKDNTLKYKYHKYLNEAPSKPSKCRCRVEQTTSNESFYRGQKIECGNEVVTIVPKTFKSFENNDKNFIWVCDDCYKRIMSELEKESEKNKKINDLNKIPRL